MDMLAADSNVSPLRTPGEAGDLRRTGAHPDHWYPVAWSVDLKPESAVGVQFAGEPIVIVRTKEGTIYALEDRCAHRQVPLSLGVVSGDSIRCTYHGWTYNCAGACTNIPYIGMSGLRMPNNIRSYPACEISGLIFVFPGDTSLAEARKPATLGRVSDPKYKTRKLNRQVAAHYSFMHENLMDMNHQFLHRKNMGMICAKCLDRRHGDDWCEVDYTFSRNGGGGQGMGEKVIVRLARDGAKKNAKFSDLMTIATRYPYQDLRVWVGRENRVSDPVLQVWLGYLPLGKDQRANRTFGFLSVLKPPVPGLIHLVWPFVSWFTERIFTEDKDIVESEQRAHDKQGRDMNNEIFPAIRDLRALLLRSGVPMDTAD